MIDDILHINVEEAKKDRLIQLDKLEEDRIMAIQHQEIKKQQQKSWHDRNIRKKVVGWKSCIAV